MADAPKSFLLTPELHAYLLAHSTPVDAVQRSLIDRTAELGAFAGMQIAPEQGAFMTLLTRLVGARSAVEVGTFTGYSAIAIARGLPDDGHLLCCDVSEEWTSVARDAWEEAGVASKIELVLGPAAETLRALPKAETIDLAFIDADKPSYGDYYEQILARLRPNGLILVDNVLWSGNVAGTSANDDNTVALRAFNDMVAADGRVESVMLPISDGVTMIRKR
ncbi:MAG TPA: O-methyltransferase [Acidimicrobiia bacterium]|jgi:caffeoyl-CoA O-methyltransferase